MRSLLGLVRWLVLVAAALIGGLSSPGAWYTELRKPPGTPPNWVFGPVWTTLYLLMAVAAWLVWKSSPEPPLRPLGLFVLQLILNAAWSWLFFVLKSPGLAFGDIVLLWLAIFFCIVAFIPISKPAAWLLAPYLGWVSYAAYLNLAIWILNRKA